MEFETIEKVHAMPPRPRVTELVRLALSRRSWRRFDGERPEFGNLFVRHPSQRATNLLHVEAVACSKHADRSEAQEQVVRVPGLGTAMRWLHQESALDVEPDATWCESAQPRDFMN